MVLVLVHPLDHGDLGDNVVDADEQICFLFDRVGEDLDCFSDGGSEAFVAFCDFAGLLGWGSTWLLVVLDAEGKGRRTWGGDGGRGYWQPRGLKGTYHKGDFSTKSFKIGAVSGKGGDGWLIVECAHDNVLDETVDRPCAEERRVMPPLENPPQNGLGKVQAVINAPGLGKRCDHGI